MSTRAAKIWRRTKVGGGLALCLAGMLTAVHFTGSPEVVLLVGWVLSVIVVLEVDRMGTLAGRGLAVDLAGPLVVVALLGLAALRGQGVAANHAEHVAPLYPDVAHAAYVGSLGVEALLAACLGAAAFAVRGLLRKPGLGLLGQLAWLVPLTVLLLGDPNEGRRSVGFAVVVAGLLGLAGLLFSAREPRGAKRALLAAALAVWLCVPLPGLARIFADYGTSGLVALVVLSKVGDIAGYYFGNAFGRHHPFPGISPGKTTEGCLASLLAGVLFGALFVAVGLLDSPRYGVVSGLVAGGAVNLASQAGDLLESFLKRRTGVKDSGTLFGPSGGFLDLVDSLLLSVPVALLVWPWLF